MNLNRSTTAAAHEENVVGKLPLCTTLRHLRWEFIKESEKVRKKKNTD